MKKILSILMLVALLLTSGCVVNKSVVAPSDDEPKKTEPESSESEATAENTEKEVDWAGGLVMLRQAMIETPQLMAVAYLGSYGGEELADIMPVKCATFCDNHPIFSELTTDMIIGSGNELYCVVAMDESADISVNRLDETGEVTEILHKTDGKKPILIAANGAGFSPDTMISIVDGNGNVASYGLAFEADSLVGNDAVHDFTSYEDILGV